MFSFTFADSNRYILRRAVVMRRMSVRVYPWRRHTYSHPGRPLLEPSTPLPLNQQWRRIKDQQHQLHDVLYGISLEDVVYLSTCMYTHAHISVYTHAYSPLFLSLSLSLSFPPLLSLSLTVFLPSLLPLLFPYSLWLLWTAASEL